MQSTLRVRRTLLVAVGILPVAMGGCRNSSSEATSDNAPVAAPDVRVAGNELTLPPGAPRIAHLATVPVAPSVTDALRIPGRAQGDADRANGEVAILSYGCHAVEVKARCAKVRARVEAETSRGCGGRCRMDAQRLPGVDPCITPILAECAHSLSGGAPISPDRELARDAIPGRAHLHET